MRLVGFVSTFLLLLMVFGNTDVYGQKKSKKRNSALASRNTALSKYVIKYKYPKKGKYYSVGGYLGSANYFGDLAPRTNRLSTDIALTRSALGGYVQRRMGQQISLRGSVAWMRIVGEDASSNPADGIDEMGRYMRNLSFRNDMFLFTGSAMFELYKTRPTGLFGRPKWTPYAHIGLTVLYHSPKAKAPNPNDFYNGQSLFSINPAQLNWTEGEWVNLRDLRTEGRSYSSVAVAIPWGVGVTFRATDRLDVGGEFTFFTLFTDYIDDVSTEYPDDATLATMSPLAIAMSNRSAESTTSYYGENRDLEKIMQAYTSKTVESLDRYSVNGNTYTRIPGFAKGGAPRGNPGGNDQIISIGVTATYHFGSSLKKPKFR